MFNYESMLKDMRIVNHNDLNYIEELLLDDEGKLIIRPYEELKDIPQTDISAFCVKNGFYSIPTKELIDFIAEEIGEDRSRVLEIGSGNGVYAKALDIRAVDNFMQLNPQVKKEYELNRQAIVPYDSEVVQKMDAFAAVKKYSPDVVLAAWVTHKYNPIEHFRGGNQFGVDEAKMLKKIKKYVFIGNEDTHKMKPILSKPHRTIKEPWILSRAHNEKKNVIWIWE